MIGDVIRGFQHALVKVKKHVVIWLKGDSFKLTKGRKIGAPVGLVAGLDFHAIA